MKKYLPQNAFRTSVNLSCRFFLIARFVCLVFGITGSVSGARAQAPVNPGSIIGKVVCGYQGWFTATGDGSPINRWTHWAPTNTPQAGVAPNPNPNLTFDVYPDITPYQQTSLFATNFAALGNGAPARLFSAYKQDVTDKHFELMQTHGIDGVAFQRFIWEVLVDPAFKANRDTVAVHVRKAAEKYSRIFYLVYDLSGLGNVPATPSTNDQERFDKIKADWTDNMLGNLHFTTSPMYAKQDGKPVVQLWGIGYNHIIGTAAMQKDLIDWFKAQGCYVIAGVPTGWRTNTGASKPAWTNTYLAANMISPWMVGAFSDLAGANTFKTNVMATDVTYCAGKSLAYQPVIFPGFSWYNWNSGTKNQIPRAKGEFMWRQASNIKALGITSAEIAMFDEYDEGTAIMNMADGYDMIPTNQYFVTSSADGTYISPDFYLRLSTKVTRLINGTDAVTANVTIPYSLGPVFFRTSHEAGYDATQTWTSTAETGTPVVNVTANGSNSGSPTCTTVQATAHRGAYDLRVAGRDRSTTSSYAYFKVYDVNIPVASNSQLNFWTMPENSLGRFVSLDLVMTDGTTLRSKGATDQNGLSMHPATGRGTVGAWGATSCNIGNWLAGKTIDRILIGYDNAAGSGDFSALVDDISINTTQFALPLRLLSFTAAPSGKDALVQWKTADESNLKTYQVERSPDGINFSNTGELQPGNTAGIKTYRFTDARISGKNGGTFYYRLKTIENGGKFSYSETKPVTFKQQIISIVKIFPNPFTDRISLSLQSTKAGILDAAISDVNGKAYKRVFYSIGTGTSTISIDGLNELPRGIYFLNIDLGGERVMHKLKK